MVERLGHVIAGLSKICYLSLHILLGIRSLSQPIHLYWMAVVFTLAALQLAIVAFQLPLSVLRDIEEGFCFS